MRKKQAEPIIEIKNLTKYFEEPVRFKVLQNISTTVYAGEFTSIVGASGSGKSTLLYVLSTLDTDYEGDIIIDGTNLRDLDKNGLASFRNEKIGFVFQFHYLLPEFSVLENVKLPAMKLGKYPEEEIEARALHKLDMLGLKDQALKKANRLSGGQQQRVAIARALINDPRIIYGDEPTGNLDSKNSKLVFDILRDLKKEFGQTILIVTHDMDFANRTDRLITLSDGYIVPSEKKRIKKG